MNIVITLPDFLEHEAERIVALLRRPDVQLIHLRKPDSTAGQLAQLIEQIPSVYYSQLVLHQHFQLAQQYHLYGIHLNHRWPQRPAQWQGSVSTSCHSIDELRQCLAQQPAYNYLSLSPIFDSVSKPGYHAAFTAQQLADARQEGLLTPRVLALGGVTFARLEQVRQMGFGGGMILGDAWRDEPDTDIIP